MKLKLEIDSMKCKDLINNSPFEELAWILRDLAKSDKLASMGQFSIYDHNGNCVGTGKIGRTYHKWKRPQAPSGDFLLPKELQP